MLIGSGSSWTSRCNRLGRPSLAVAGGRRNRKPIQREAPRQQAPGRVVYLMDRTRQLTGEMGEFDMVLGWIDFVIIGLVIAFVLDQRR